MKPTTNHIARLITCVLAVGLCAASLFLSWWTITYTGNGGQRIDHAAPYDAGRMADTGTREGLDAEVLVTGLLISVAGAACLVLLVFEVLPLVGVRLPQVLSLSPAGLSILLGAAASLYTFFVWPGAEPNNDLAFFDSVGFTGAMIETAAGVGWYLAIVGAVVLPTIAGVLRLNEAPDITQMA